MNTLTSEQVKAEVTRFWSTFSSKSEEMLEEFYMPEATVFSSTAARAEPGRLAAVRRKREYFHPQTTVRVQLGPIDVLLLGNDAAIASYTFQFHASKVSGALGKPLEEDIEHGRGTQVFVREGDGKLRILHEHLSTVTQHPAAH